MPRKSAEGSAPHPASHQRGSPPSAGSCPPREPGPQKGLPGSRPRKVGCPLGSRLPRSRREAQPAWRPGSGLVPPRRSRRQSSWPSRYQSPRRSPRWRRDRQSSVSQPQGPRARVPRPAAQGLRHRRQKQPEPSPQPRDREKASPCPRQLTRYSPQPSPRPPNRQAACRAPIPHDRALARRSRPWSIPRSSGWVVGERRSLPGSQGLSGYERNKRVGKGDRSSGEVSWDILGTSPW